MDLAEIIKAQQAIEFPRRRRARRPRQRKIRASGSAAADRVRAARQFRTLTSGITEALRTKLFPLLRRLEGDFLLDATRLQDDFADEIQAVIDQIRSEHLELAGRRALVLASDLTAQVNERNRARFFGAIENTIGIDLRAVVDESSLGPILKMKTAENVSLIKTIPENYFAKIETLVFENVIQGRTSAKSMIEELRELGEITERRARFIARDQTAKLTASLNQKRNQALGITEYIWRTSRDERVRKGRDGSINGAGSHRAKNGKRFKWSDPPADTGHPGEDFQCLPGSVEIDLAEGCHKLWRRFYEGPMVSVVTSDSRLLKATPNHPVLTSRGWIPINDLKEGDDLVHCVVNRRSVIEDNEGDLVTRFDDLFDAASIAEEPETSDGSEFDFHGDGSENDVDVVGVDSLLKRYGVAAFYQRLLDLGLTWADENSRIAALDAVCALDGSRENTAFGHGSNGGVGGFGSGFPLGRGHSAGHDIRGHAAIPPEASIERKDSGDDIARHVESISQGKLALSELVGLDDLSFRKVVSAVMRLHPAVPGSAEFGVPSADCLAEIVRVAAEEGRRIFEHGSVRYQLLRVVEKTVREYSAHVYNLSNGRQCYAADGFIVHNCRCTAEPVIVV